MNFNDKLLSHINKNVCCGDGAHSHPSFKWEAIELFLYVCRCGSLNLHIFAQTIET